MSNVASWLKRQVRKLFPTTTCHIMRVERTGSDRETERYRQLIIVESWLGKVENYVSFRLAEPTKVGVPGTEQSAKLQRDYMRWRFTGIREDDDATTAVPA